MSFVVLRLFLDLPRRCARGSRGNRGPDSLDPPAVSRSTPGRRLTLVGYRPHRAFSSVASRLPSGRGTVRPNQSFKPTPLRGAA